MNAFTQGNLASASRQLQRCIDHLKDAVESPRGIVDAAVHAQAALRFAQWAAEGLDGAVRLEQMTEDQL